MRRSLVIGAVLLAVAFLFVGGPSLFASPSTSDVVPETEPDPELLTFEDAESGFWIYLNDRQAFEKRSPINVVVRGDTETVVDVMQAASDSNWTETDDDQAEANTFTHSVQSSAENDSAGETDEQLDESENTTFELLPTDISWSPTTGATRYAHVDPGDEAESYWATETAQLHDGTYYGQRYHIRLYESPTPDDEWVAMQTHTEHFDWFTLRHRVDGVEAAQSHLENDFMDHPQIDRKDDVRRINLENSGPSDADGWATIVDLLGMVFGPLVFGLAAGSNTFERTREDVSAWMNEHLTETDRRRLETAVDRFEPEHLLLGGTIVALMLGVRYTGIALEHSVDSLTMHQIAAILYPVIALGIPIATYAIASRLERRLDAAVTASLSLAVAIWLDYGLLGVDSLPIDVVVQRMFVVVALGLVAAGAAKRATRDSRVNALLVVGLVLWALVLGGTLFGYL